MKTLSIKLILVALMFPVATFAISGLPGTSIPSTGGGSSSGGGSMLPFGGMSIMAQYCTCSQNWLITLMPAGGTPSRLIYQPGATRLYPFGQVMRSGVYMMGTWMGMGACVNYLPLCVFVQTAPMMQMVGTSM